MVFLRSLLFLVLLLPIVELILLISVGTRTGARPVFWFLAVSFLVGWIVHQRSRPLSIGRISGILLMVPGFVTDFLALAILVPGVRQLFLGSLLKNSPWSMHGSVTDFKRNSYGDGAAPTPGAESGQKGFDVPKEHIKDAEFRILPDEDSSDGS